ncbi:PIG-L deacetylase family protein [Fulvivirga sedimenti]|uniref:PIG-L family deacetylase n=1 Tax=Fulvivirga sedimenti TaxID=2879465 RepID=A0A9X1KXS8_9BACT|nr:PIG-L family deacetylase [Fulvivirga sedimenti]MCA6074492.1 PIG-L family deacetylase [Fulvivirga sedimenti]MCA6075669.1 PIG-L family deacetylase [Fulvivirga sedimenti]MCA6076797.1 PIG-L family deacetylase [Fulvivirga sedimenti]
MKRREILKSGAAGIIASSSIGADVWRKSAEKMKILVTGAHPDDPETGCGGTIARYSQAGHDVTVLYLTRGEAGIPGTGHEEAAAIRTHEAEAACKILGAKPLFAGQVDGDTMVTNEWNKKIGSIIASEKPDIIFTQWPVDTHRDHRACALMVYDAWLYGGRKQAFYYYEVMTGSQTMNFNPTDYVDISGTIKRKWDACFVHESQKIRETYDQDHGKMEIFRGMEGGYQYAEAFVRLQQSKQGILPA